MTPGFRLFAFGLLKMFFILMLFKLLVVIGFAVYKYRGDLSKLKADCQKALDTAVTVAQVSPTSPSTRRAAMEPSLERRGSLGIPMPVPTWNSIGRQRHLVTFDAILVQWTWKLPATRF